MFNKRGWAAEKKLRSLQGKQGHQFRARLTGQCWHLSGFGNIRIALVAWSHNWVIFPLQLNNARSLLLGFLHRFLRCAYMPYAFAPHVSRGAMLHLLQDNILGLRL